METGHNPIHLLCPQCGAAAHYDIADRLYHCSYCRSETSPGQQLDQAKEWLHVRQKKLSKEVMLSSTRMYTCPGCGAKVIIQEGEAVGSCSFCSSSLAAREYTEKDSFPESIIPFKISEDEAKEKLKRFISRQKNLKVKKVLKKNVDELRGYYLPYQFIRGPVECTVYRDMSQRKYHCGSYVDKIVVNASRQLKNEVLDAAEPFDFDECQDFNFGYVADHRVKMQDVDDNELLKRSEKEVIRDCLGPIEKTMHSKGISVIADHAELEKLPLLLPMYVINRTDLSVAVNGQSGKIAVSLNRMIDKNRFWFIEPLATTLVLSCASALLSKNIGMGLMIGAAVAAISFTAFGQDKESHPELQIFVSDHDDKGEKQAKPVFREDSDEGRVNVDISFFPLRRILFHLVGMILFNAMPLLIAMFFQWCQDLRISDLHFLYIDIWLVISLPMSFIFWTAYLRRDVYDHPVIKKILPDGSLKKIRDRKKETLLSVMKQLISQVNISDIKAALLVLGLPILMFVMSVYLIMTG